MEPQKMFVALLLPTSASDSVEVIGVFTTQEKAEAKCFRIIGSLGYYQEMVIFPVFVDYSGGP